jgi:alanine racemase
VSILTLDLRAAGITTPVLVWLLAPGLPLHKGIAAGVDLSAVSLAGLVELVHAARGPRRYDGERMVG